MTSFPYRAFDPLLPESAAREIVALCERFGSYGMYSEEGLNEGIGEGLPQRFDAAFNFVRTGGRFGRREDLKTLAARTNYFRYAENLEKARIDDELNRERISNAIVAQSATLAEKPVRPSKMIVGLLALILAGAASVASVLTAEAWRDMPPPADEFGPPLNSTSDEKAAAPPSYATTPK